MASYTPTNWVAHETLISADRMNNLEQGIAAFYPQEVVIAPEQTVTITAETAPQAGVPITLAEGYELPIDIPEDWSVTVNGLSLNWNSSFLANGGYMTQATIGETSCVVAVWRVATSPMDQHLALTVFPDKAETPVAVPGDYTVKITKGAPARIPVVAAFPISAGSGNTLWVIDAPKEDVDAAMVNGCVLLYAASPSKSSGFAFGCLVGSVMYYASFGEKFGWNSGIVTLKNGKYVVLGVG